MSNTGLCKIGKVETAGSGTVFAHACNFAAHSVCASKNVRAACCATSVAFISAANVACSACNAAGAIRSESAIVWSLSEKMDGEKTFNISDEKERLWDWGKLSGCVQVRDLIKKS